MDWSESTIFASANVWPWGKETFSEFRSRVGTLADQYFVEFTFYPSVF